MEYVYKISWHWIYFKNKEIFTEIDILFWISTHENYYEFRKKEVELQIYYNTHFTEFKISVVFSRKTRNYKICRKVKLLKNDNDEFILFLKF